MNKCIRALALILTLALFFLMALGSGSGDYSSSSSVSRSTKSSDVDSNDENEMNSIGEGSSASVKSGSLTVSIEEYVVFEDGGIRITAKGWTPKSLLLGPGIKFLIENNSNKAITVHSRNSTVNGYMVDTTLSSTVAAGKKANDTMYFSQTDLDYAGITTIADIEFTFHFVDPDSWDTVMDSEIVRILTSAADGFEYNFDESGALVYDERGIRIVIKGVSMDDSILGPSVLVYIYNYGNEEITVQARNVSLNGFMVDHIFSCTVNPGKRAVDTITFLSSDLKKNEIETIEELELSFHVYGSSIFKTIVETTPVAVTFG